MKRVFLAAEISAGARAAAAVHIAEMRSRFREVRASWVRPENLHVTLRFFGDADDAKLTAVKRLAGAASAECLPFTVRLSAAASFGARVLFLSLEDEAGGFAELNRRIEKNAAAAGFEPETRPFRPHLTIARIRSEKGVRPLIEANRAAAVPPIAFAVKEIVLFESTLAASGSIYTPLGRFPLTGTAENG